MAKKKNKGLRKIDHNQTTIHEGPLSGSNSPRNQKPSINRGEVPKKKPLD